MPKLDASNDDNKKYKIEAILDSAIYTNKSKSGHLLGFYYLVTWKDYFKKEITWKPLSAVQYLKKIISYFHKDYLKKPTSTFLPIDSILVIAGPTVKLNKTTKCKRGLLAKSASKQVINLILRYLWYLSNLFVNLANNNSKLNKIGLSKILNLEFFFIYNAGNQAKKIDYSLFQINSRAFFVKL